MKKIMSVIVTVVMSLMFAVSAYADSTINPIVAVSENSVSDNWVDPMPHIIDKEPEIPDCFVTVKRGKYTIEYNKKDVELARKTNKYICDYDNSDLKLTVTHKNGTVYSGSDVVIKCKDTNKGIKVIIKKVGKKRMRKFFYIYNEIHGRVLTR
jgi:hypothetical protein